LPVKCRHRPCYAVDVMRYYSLKRGQSIRARLSLVFLFLFLLVIILGLESLHGLSYVNDASAQIRGRWLPSTRALGDLNNLTTDYPAAEDAMLRASSANQQAVALRQMTDLDRGINAAQDAYRQIHHDAAEDDLYRRFESQWSEYRVVVAGFHAAAESRSAYDAASETLGLLTERNVASARDASERSDLVYVQARGRIACTIILAGLLVAGAMLYVTRSISAPLVDLAQRMHRLAASEIRIEVQGTQRHDEIGEMARAVVVFRNNAVDLAQNRHALAEQAAQLQEKLAEEQRLTLLQRNFVSMASHEFRTPLAIIDGHAQRFISMRDRLTADEITQRARKVRSTVGRMTQMINNLIGSARLIDGRLELNYHPTQVDLAALVREICHLQRELTPEAQILDQLPHDALPVYGDASLLSQVFGNLLSNAVKYSPDAGLIRVTTHAHGAEILVVIEDHGIGIPEGEHEQVFERYYRGSNTTGIIGSGVGLYLVKTIVELHKGRVELLSGEGEGSRFTVQLPRLAAETHTLRAEPECETLGRGATYS
jgi:two-component system, OmpR family, sensor kinase